MLLTILDILVAAGLIAVILLQMQGSGISSSFGGTGEFFRSKRSIEKILIRLTIFLALVFALISIILLVLR